MKTANLWARLIFGRVVRSVWHHLAIIVITALIGLVLYGVVGEGSLASLVLLIVAARGAALIREACRRPWTEADWMNRYSRLLTQYSARSAEQLERDARDLGLEGRQSAADV